MSTPPQNPSSPTPTPSSPPGATRAAGGADRSQASDSGQRFAEDAKAQTRAEVDKARDSAAGKAETLAQSARAAADALGRDDIGHMSRYVSDLADGMARFADGLRHKSGDELARDVGRIARENPALFVAGSVAIGFGLSRFARASRHRDHAMVPADEARPGFGQSPQRAGSAGNSTDDGGLDGGTVYRAGSLHAGDPADSDLAGSDLAGSDLAGSDLAGSDSRNNDSRNKGGTH